MGQPVWTDNPYGLSGQVNVVGEATIGSESNPLTKLYVEDLVITGDETSEGGQVAPTFQVTDTDNVLNEDGLTVNAVTLGNGSVLDEDGLVILEGSIAVAEEGSHIGQPTQNTVTAAGSATGDATVIAEVFTNVTTVAASTGVRFAELPNGSCKYVKNSGANALTVYPPTGGTINGGAADAGVSIATGAIGVFIGITSTVAVAGEMPAA